MYQLSDSQIDFILNDIRARGVEMEGLQDNLLDHVCCIIEQNLEANGDFEHFYQKTIRTFYKDALWEIEEETLLLLTFKNYYTMKKIMIWSGVFSVITLTFGIWFKYMHWPGASILIVSGILSSSLIFLPLLFTLKAKEKQKTKDKYLIGISALGVILISLSFLFKVMHWPYSIELVYASAILMLLIFLPLFFFSGIRQEETKLNTITTSMLIIMVYGLLFMLIRSPQSTLSANLSTTQELGIALEILRNEERLTPRNQDSISPAIRELNIEIDRLCNECKNYLQWNTFKLDTATVSKYMASNLKNRALGGPFKDDEIVREKIDQLSMLVEKYNLQLAKLGSNRLSRIRVTHTFLDKGLEVTYFSISNVLTQLTQIQMFLLQNTRTLLLLK